MAKRRQKHWFRRGVWWDKIRLNRKHKDRLFRYLFNDKKYLLDLYNALHGSHYMDPEALEVVTMEDVIFMKMKNDLSFMIDSRLNLYEHQSSWNPNMPLRGLFYFSQQYEGMLGVEDADVYGRKRIELPTPEYIVFYNGSDMTEERKRLYLSDSFSMGHSSGCLECICEVININRGHNRELMEKCHRLWEYSEFVSEVKANIRAGMKRQEAIQSAIDCCIERDILTDILRTEKSEVLHMIFLTEYDERKHLKDTYEEGKEDGRKEGREEGREDKLVEMIHKKQVKGKSPEVIAAELEEDLETIHKLLRKHGG